MGKILYFDCFSGISGDMALAALLDLGIDFETFRAELAKLGLEDEYQLTAGHTSVSGISALDLSVTLKDGGSRHERNPLDICAIIDKSAISDGAKALARRIFNLLARAEAKVHNTAIEKVHFHEVGAADSIVDIVGAAICIDMLKPDKIMCSCLSEGTGFVDSRHGRIPVPVPATLEILRSRGVPYRITDENGEMVTPTGAAIAAALSCDFGPPPPSAPVAIGYGAGKRRFNRPNILRAMLLEAGDAASGQVEVLECNIDDSTPEALGFALEAVFDAGALDAFFTPIYMKKNRPAVMLTAICDAGMVFAVQEAIFAHTSTLGIRRHTCSRSMLSRKITTVQTKYGNIKVKVSEFKGKKRFAPEYEDVRAAAKAAGAQFIDVYNAAVAAAE